MYRDLVQSETDNVNILKDKQTGTLFVTMPACLHCCKNKIKKKKKEVIKKEIIIKKRMSNIPLGLLNINEIASRISGEIDNRDITLAK
jgi:hypothetical protein